MSKVKSGWPLCMIFFCCYADGWKYFMPFSDLFGNRKVAHKSRGLCAIFQRFGAASIQVRLLFKCGFYSSAAFIQVRLLFKCGFYSSAAFIQVRLLFKCGFYSSAAFIQVRLLFKCGFYSSAAFIRGRFTLHVYQKGKRRLTWTLHWRTLVYTRTRANLFLVQPFFPQLCMRISVAFIVLSCSCLRGHKILTHPPTPVSPIVLVSMQYNRIYIDISNTIQENIYCYKQYNTIEYIAISNTIQ